MIPGYDGDDDYAKYADDEDGDDDDDFDDDDYDFDDDDEDEKDDRYDGIVLASMSDNLKRLLGLDLDPQSVKVTDWLAPTASGLTNSERKLLICYSRQLCNLIYMIYTLLCLTYSYHRSTRKEA